MLFLYASCHADHGRVPSALETFNGGNLLHGVINDVTSTYTYWQLHKWHKIILLRTCAQLQYISMETDVYLYPKVNCLQRAMTSAACSMAK